ncbi:unnamed protein product [Bathycoccus prasinos]|jgi:hypothetical protein
MIASSSSSSAAAAANCNGGEQHFLQRRRRIFSSALASTSGASSSRWSPSNSWTTGRTRRDKRRRRRRRRNDDDESDDGVVRSFPPLRARKTRYEYEREKDDDELRKDEDLELLRDLMLEDNTEEEEEEEDDEEEDETLGRTTRRRRRAKADINAGAGGDDFETLITPRAKYRARIDASPDATWEAVSDASLFSTFAPNVRTSLRSFSSSGGVSTYRLASDCRDEVILCANELRGEIFLEVVLLPPEKATMSSSSSSSSSSSQLISSKDTLANRRKKQPEAPTISRTLSFSSRDVDRRNGEFECFGKIKVARLKSASFACELSYECEIRPTKYPVLRRALERVMRQSFEEIATAINQRASSIQRAKLNSPFLDLETLNWNEASEEFYYVDEFDDDGYFIGRRKKRRDGRLANAGLKPENYLGLSEVSVPLVQQGGDENDREGTNTNNTNNSTTKKKMMSISGRFRPPTVRRNVMPPAENLSWQAAQGNTTSGAQGGRWFDEIVDADAAEDLSTSAPGSIEVHNRRYDTPAVYHRRTLSAVRIEAPPSLVWKVLTAYESLAKFAPNLVHCEVLPNATLGVAVPGGGVAGGTGKNLKRLRFVFLKHCLCHAIYESVGVDLSQKDEEGEIQFRVSRNQRRDGVLQGKFLVVPANDSIDDDDDDIDGSATLRSFDEKYDGTFSVSKLDRADFNDFNDAPEEAEATILKFAIEGINAKANYENGRARKPPLDERQVVDETIEFLTTLRAHIEAISLEKVIPLVTFDNSVRKLNIVPELDQTNQTIAEFMRLNPKLDEEQEDSIDATISRDDDELTIAERAKLYGLTEAAMKQSTNASASLSEKNGKKKKNTYDMKSFDEDEERELFEALRVDIEAFNATLLLKSKEDGKTQQQQQQQQQQRIPQKLLLREYGREDLEKRIRELGGYKIVSEKFGWDKNMPKPRGYWRDLENVRVELESFMESLELPLDELPSRGVFVENGREDIYQSFRFHGGASEVAMKLGLVGKQQQQQQQQ